MLRRFVHKIRQAHRAWQCRHADLTSWAEISPVFIVSTGRTGTQFFADIIEANLDQVHALHEPTPDMWDAAMGYIRGDVDAEGVRRAFLKGRYLYLRAMRSRGQRIFVESNNNLSFVLPILREMFPAARFIHVTRDLRNLVRSSFSKKVHARDAGPNDGKTALFLTPQDARQRFNAKDCPDGPYADSWEMLSRFEQICWLLQKKDRMIWDALDDTSTCLRIRFEDVFNAETGYGEFSRILSFIEPDLSLPESIYKQWLARPRNATEEYILPKWPEWTAEQKDAFVRIAGPHQQRCGYDLP
jgi:hypothetical protein